MMELSGIKYTEQELIQAKIADSMAWLCWSKTKDAELHRNMPESLVEKMLGVTKEDDNPFGHDVFSSSEEFLRAREKALRKG